MAGLKLKTRDEVDAKDKWAIEDLYKTDEEWKADYEKLKVRIPELPAYQGRLGESAEVAAQIKG